jgi:hypothetical protein
VDWLFTVLELRDSREVPRQSATVGEREVDKRVVEVFFDLHDAEHRAFRVLI